MEVRVAMEVREGFCARAGFGKASARGVLKSARGARGDVEVEARAVADAGGAVGARRAVRARRGERGGAASMESRAQRDARAEGGTRSARAHFFF